MAMGTMRDEQMFIGGVWGGAADRNTYTKTNPFSGAAISRVPAGGRTDVEAAVDAAAAAFPEWSSSAPGMRRGLFLKAAEVLEARREDLARLITEETGGTFGWGMFNCMLSSGILREAAAESYGLIGEIIPSDLPDTRAMAIRQPVGVVVGIAPWNAPLILGFRAVAIPLAYGNTVVLKASEESPGTQIVVPRIEEVSAAGG